MFTIWVFFPPCHQVSQLKILLQSVLDQWSIYKVAYEELNSYLMEVRYSLSRFHLLTGSMEAVKVQVDNLQVKMKPLAMLKEIFGDKFCPLC